MRWKAVVVLCLLVFAGKFAAAQAATSQGGSTSPSTNVHSKKGTQPPRLIRLVEPSSPPLFNVSWPGGNFIYSAVIAKDGTLQGIQSIAPVPTTSYANYVQNALQRWRYIPMLVKGRPKEAPVLINILYVTTYSNVVAPSDKALEPDFMRDTTKLLDTIHYREVISQAVMAALAPDAPEMKESFPETPNRDKIVAAYRAKMLDFVQSPALSENAMKFYAHTMTDGDIQQLTAFYGSPVGQRLIAGNLAIPYEVRQSALDYTRVAAWPILGELCNEYPELQGTADFCHK